MSQANLPDRQAYGSQIAGFLKHNACPYRRGLKSSAAGGITKQKRATTALKFSFKEVTPNCG